MKKILILSAIAAALAILFYFVAEHQKEKAFLASPTFALNEIERAVKSKNIQLFETYVNVEALSENILTQILTEETPAEAPKQEGLTGLFSKLGQNIAGRFNEYIRPELQRSLNEQIRTFVGRGLFGTEKIDISSIYSGKPMLKTLWEDISGPAITFEGFSDVAETATTATAIATFHRADIDYKAPFVLHLENENGVWRLNSIHNLKNIMERIEDIEHKQFLNQQKEIATRLNSMLKVNSIQKSTGVSEWGVGKGLMLSVAFENVSEMDITAFKTRLTFKNLQGEELRSVTLEDTDPLNQGQISEKSWPMALNPLSSSDKFLFEAADASLTIDAQIIHIIPTQGEEITLPEKQ